MAIFTRRSLLGEELRIYGDGTQTRDLLYVEDCARFVADALLSDARDRPDPQRRHGPRRVGQRAGGAHRTRPGAHRPRPAHPPAERDRGPALRPAPGGRAPRLASRRSTCRPAWAASATGWRRSWPRASRSADGLARPACAWRSTEALRSGRPILPYAHQVIDDADVAAVSEALRSDWLTTGPRVPAFEAAAAGGDGRPPRGRVQLRDGRAARRGGRRRPRPRR